MQHNHTPADVQNFTDVLRLVAGILALLVAIGGAR